jgi:hypothetical protein
MLRENAWISRLETSGFALAATALCTLARPGPTLRRLLPLAVGAAAVPLLAYGGLLASFNELRPLSLHPVDATTAYYSARPAQRGDDDAALAAARTAECRRLGFATKDTDPWDYPLLWRARSEGIELRHVAGDDDWPCLLVCQLCRPLAGRWVNFPGTYVFAREP